MLIGLIAYLATRNFSDYVLGGRRLGGAVAALSAGASDMSSWLLFSLPGFVYSQGIQEIWVALGLTIGAYTCWRSLAKRLRIYSEVTQDALTIPAYLDNRFRDQTKAIRMMAALAILIFFMFYIASGLYASGILLKQIFGLKYEEALCLGTAIVLLYTSVGGFLAVSWTDFFQGTLMLCCLLIVPVCAFKQIPHPDQAWSKLILKTPDFFKFTQNFNGLQMLSNLSWGLGYFGMPHILVRFMSVKTTREIPLARRICMAWMTLSMAGAILVGITAALYFADTHLTNAETVFIALSEKVFSPGLMGIVLAAILSSSMCAIDSQMLAASSALTEDFYRILLRKKASQKELMWVGRLTVIFIALAAIAIARVPNQSIMTLVAFAWAGLGATFGPAVVASLFWRRTTAKGVFAGMLSGCVTVILWQYLGWSSVLYDILPGVLVSTLALSLVSLIDTPPASEILAEFDQVRAQDHQCTAS